jgi:hypothetical protein
MVVSFPSYESVVSNPRSFMANRPSWTLGAMLHKADLSAIECLMRADECEQLSQRLLNPRWKETFRRMAGHWRAIAQSIDVGRNSQ